MKNPQNLLFVFILSLSLGFTACDSDKRSEAATENEETEVQIGTEDLENVNQGLVEVMQSQGNLSSFLSLVENARLAETLQGAGPFTIFAPSDEAFQKLPKGQMDQLKKLDFQELRPVLSHHMMSRRLVQSDVKSGITADMLGGNNLPLRMENGNIMIGDARVVKQSIPARNGVIHIIDRVLFPEGFRLGQ